MFLGRREAKIKENKMQSDYPDPGGQLQGRVESLREEIFRLKAENTRLKAENKKLKGKADTLDAFGELAKIVSPIPDFKKK